MRQAKCCLLAVVCAVLCRIQLVGGHFAEATLLRAAAALEQCLQPVVSVHFAGAAGQLAVQGVQQPQQVRAGPETENDVDAVSTARRDQLGCTPADVRVPAAVVKDDDRARRRPHAIKQQRQQKKKGAGALLQPLLLLLAKGQKRCRAAGKAAPAC